jgi:hypothetical protein
MINGNGGSTYYLPIYDARVLEKVLISDTATHSILAGR